MVASNKIYERALSIIEENIKNLDLTQDSKNSSIFFDKKKTNENFTISDSTFNNLKELKPYLCYVLDTDNKYIKAILPYLIFCFYTNMIVEYKSSSTDIKDTDKIIKLDILCKKITLTNLTDNKKEYYDNNLKNYLIHDIKTTMYKRLNIEIDVLNNIRKEKNLLINSYLNKFKYSLFTYEERKARPDINRKELNKELKKINLFSTLLLNDKNCNLSVCSFLFNEYTKLFNTLPCINNNFYFNLAYNLSEKYNNIQTIEQITDFLDKVPELTQHILENEINSPFIENLIDILINYDPFKDFIKYVTTNKNTDTSIIKEKYFGKYAYTKFTTGNKNIHEVLYQGSIYLHHLILN